MKTRLLYLLPLLLTVTLIIFGEALGDLWKEDVKALFQQNKWLLLAFVLLLALLGYLWERQQRHEKTAPEAVDKDQYDEAFVQFRKNLLEQYQTRLKSKTGRRLPVNLTAKSTHFGTAPARVQAYFKDKEQTIESENIASEIDKILNDNARLLLIGDPGAGKTTILLYAAINILNTSYSSDDSKSSDESQKLPLILNLATWTKGRDFAEWYAQNIAHTYSLSPVFVQELLWRNAVVPFFDGFDEVAEEHRDDCFQKMAAYFGDEKRKQLIVSSRNKEYAAAQADAPMYAEIEVLPLSLEQIKKALTENAESQAADRALLHAIENDKWLAEAVETPFYLNTASFLFGKGQRTLTDFPFEADSTEGRQAELVKIFVAEQVPEERDRRYLGFLAGKMEQENFLVFELVKMQPKWGRILWKWRLVFVLLGILTCSLTLALSFGCSFALFRGFISGVSLGFPLGALVGSFVGFFIFLIIGVTSYEIHTADIKIWNRRTFVKTWRSTLPYALGYGFMCGLTLGLSLSLLFIFAVWKSNSNSGTDDFVLFLMVYSSVLGLIAGLAFGLRESGSTTNFLLHIGSPYRRFKVTFLNHFWIVLILMAYLTANVTVAISDEGRDLIDLVMWLGFFGLLFLLIPTLFSQIPHHFSLRLVLYLEGKMPLRVVTFMDRMTDQLIFEDNRRQDKKGRKRRGATWRFRHKILQDYFAGKPS